jgi:hypothetical protein
MNRFFLCAFCALLIVASPTYAADESRQPRTVSLDDLVLLLGSGISDQTILTFLENRELDFVLSKEIILSLAQAGITNRVLQYIKDQEAELNPPSETALIGFSSINYPSYYDYGRINGSIYPLAWYGHHYLTSQPSSSHPYTPVYIGNYGIEHEISHNLGSTGTHLPTLLGGHQNNLTGNVLHQGSAAGHGTQHDPVRAIEHAAGRSGGHSVGHSIGHSVGYSSGHSVGHTSGLHLGGHSSGYSGGHSRSH